MKTQWRIAKNALANLVKGGSAGAAALLLPAILIRHMSKTEYAVWVLVLQVAAYSSYLEFGLQTAVGRYVAVANEKQDRDQRDAIFSTAMVGLILTGILGISCLLIVIFAAKWLFPGIPEELLPHMKWALLIVGVSVAGGLPSSAWSGIFIGMQRHELITLATGGAKLLSAISLAVASIRGASLLQMASILASINFVSYLVLYILVKRFTEVSFKAHLVQRAVARELFSYCMSLTVWSISMMLVNGLDLLLVGRFQLEALAPYSMAITLVTLLAGIQSAIFGATMPHAAVLHARKNSEALGKMVISATRLGVLILVLSGLPLLIYSPILMKIWVGKQYSLEAHMPLTILLIANMVRLSGLPYATVLVASAQQRLVTLSPILEGVSNLVASILLGMKFGAVGVATGTLVGAIIGMAGHVFYNMPRTQREIVVHIPNYIFSGIIIPVLATIPLFFLTFKSTRGVPPDTLSFIVLFGIAIFLSGAIVVPDLRKRG
jgi:O-antigen/teichoic acid export membrane protein